jgi:hypothetical protein
MKNYHQNGDTLPLSATVLPDATGSSIFAIAKPLLSQHLDGDSVALPPLKHWVANNYR